jgi:Uma2 family endonuclease
MAIAAGPIRIPMPLEQFKQLPEGPPFCDYFNGVAVELNRPSARHQDIVVCLAYTLRTHVRQHGLGVVAADVDVRLPSGDWVGPDITYLAPDKVDLLDEEKGDIFGAPTLVVEVLSPSTAMYDRIEKFALYEHARVEWVWLVDQDTLSIEEFQWTADGYLRIGGVPGGQPFTPRAVPTLTIDLATLME